MTTKLKHSSPNICILFILLLLGSNNLLKAQKDYKWEKNAQPTETIPEAFKDQDAVMIYEHEELQSKFDLSRKIIKRRIKIQTELGLEKYARIVMPKQQYMGISILDARTIKQDGSVVDLKAKDIKAIDVVSEDDIFEKDEYYLFKVPGVEVGDEIEMICIYEGYAYYTGGTVSLHSYLPVLKAKYTLRINNGLPFTAARYNDMPKPVVDNTLNEFRCIWTAKNLPGLYDQRWAIPLNSIPYTIYDISVPKTGRKKQTQWAGLVKEIDKDHSDIRIRSKKKLNAIYEKIIGDKSSASKYEQAVAVHNYINKEMRIMNIPDEEQSNGIEYFLEEKKANSTIIFQIYKNLMEHLDLNYSLAIGRNRYYRDFHVDFPSSYQITNYLFLIENDKKELQIFPLKSRWTYFEVNEIPTRLEGTTLYAMDMQEKDSLRYFKIPFSDYKQNKRLRKIRATVDLETKEMAHTVTENMTGAVSTQIRHFYDKASKDGDLEKTFEKILDERIPGAIFKSISNGEMSNKPPFKYQLDYEYELKNKITKLDDDVFKIDIENWFSHNIQPVKAEGRVLDYHPMNSSIDAYNYYVEFKRPVKLANKENLDIKISNEVGSYELIVNQIGDNAISIRSKYIIKLNHITVDKVQLLDDLNQAARKADAEGVLIQL